MADKDSGQGIFVIQQTFVRSKMTQTQKQPTSQAFVVIPCLSTSILKPSCVAFYFPAFITAKVAPFSSKMAPVTRRTSFPKVVIERDSNSEQSSSDEEEEEEAAAEELEEDPETLQEEEDDDVDNGDRGKFEVNFDAKKKGKSPITISLKKVCKVFFQEVASVSSFSSLSFHDFLFLLLTLEVIDFWVFVVIGDFKVCKKPGHAAGFKGATYIDCPMKPCFLCKMPGNCSLHATFSFLVFFA